MQQLAAKVENRWAAGGSSCSSGARRVAGVVAWDRLQLGMLVDLTVANR